MHLTAMLAPSDSPPEFRGSWLPGDAIKLPGTEDAATVIDFDSEDFDVTSLPT